MEHLRKQYAKRAPDINILGTVDEPIDWATLGLGQKVRHLASFVSLADFTAPHP